LSFVVLVACLLILISFSFVSTELSD